MTCQLFAHFVYFQLEQEWNYMRKLFTNFLLAFLSPASLEKCLEHNNSAVLRGKIMKVQKQLHLIIVPPSFTYNEENNSLRGFQSILQFWSEFS